MLERKGRLRLVGLGEEICGLTFTNTFVVADEMQNATLPQIGRLVGRQGKGTKMVLMGDHAQFGRGANYQADTSALEKFASKCEGLTDRVVVRLKQVVRSGGASNSMGIMDELMEEDKAQRPRERQGGGANFGAVDALQSLTASAKQGSDASASRSEPSHSRQAARRGRGRHEPPSEPPRPPAAKSREGHGAGGGAWQHKVIHKGRSGRR